MSSVPIATWLVLFTRGDWFKSRNIVSLHNLSSRQVHDEEVTGESVHWSFLCMQTMSDLKRLVLSVSVKGPDWVTQQAGEKHGLIHGKLLHFPYSRALIFKLGCQRLHNSLLTTLSQDDPRTRCNVTNIVDGDLTLLLFFWQLCPSLPLSLLLSSLQSTLSDTFRESHCPAHDVQGLPVL